MRERGGRGERLARAKGIGKDNSEGQRGREGERQKAREARECVVRGGERRRWKKRMEDDEDEEDGKVVGDETTEAVQKNWKIKRGRQKRAKYGSRRVDKIAN